MGAASSYNKKAKWIDEYEVNYSTVEFEPITLDEITEATKKFWKWKRASVDSIQNLWWSKFEKIYARLLAIYKNIVGDPEIWPDWFVTCQTNLITKKDQTEVSSSYRPITCLPITYKILSSIMTKRRKYHLQRYDLTLEEQKGGVSEKQGTIDLLLIGSWSRQTKSTKPISSLDRLMESFWFNPTRLAWSIIKIHKFPSKITNFLSTLTKSWKTSLHISAPNETISTNLINILNRLFQDDCPSGLLVILCHLLLLWWIKESKISHCIGHRNQRVLVDHLLFMFHIKLYANKIRLLQNLLEIVSKFCNHIRMNFGLDKCTILNILKRKLIPSEDITLSREEAVKTPDIRDEYKYYGVFESTAVDRTETRKKYRDRYFNRVTKTLKKSLNSKNNMQAINTFAVHSISYGFQVLDWSITKLEDINRQTRNELRKQLCYTKIVTRIVSRPNGVRGLLNITDLYKSQIITYSQKSYWCWHQLSKNREEPNPLIGKHSHICKNSKLPQMFRLSPRNSNYRPASKRNAQTKK